MDEKESLAADVATISQIGAVKKILQVVCRTTGLGFSAVVRVTDKRWVACAVQDGIAFGLQPGSELKLETTICHEIRQSGKALAIDDVVRDGVFCNHPAPKQYGFRSYISVPIILVNGEFFGTLYAIDPKPARVNTPEILGMFTLFADLIAQHLDSQARMLASENALATARKIAHLRDQFVAVLGHDLRNPLGAILSATDVLNLLQPTQDMQEMISIIQRSGRRMAGLISDVLDFARGTMGEGVSIHRVASPELANTLAHVIEELQIAWPNRVLRQEIALSRPVSCDAARIAQVLSNLLANAMTHGAADQPVSIRARTTADVFELSVANRGAPIGPEIIDQLFQPFVRGKVRPGQQGLGLGLYIASEIARAHGGTLKACSSEAETCFTLTIPID